MIQGGDRARTWGGILGAVAVALGVGCQGISKSSPDLRGSMIDAYSATEALYPYVWSPTAFSDPASEATILSLLNRLSRDFHNIERTGSRYSGDPGFVLALKMQQDMLADITKRFAQGNKDYANWRLRALTGNCVSCHTRVNVPSDFVGAGPTLQGGTFEDRLAAADVLLATRQFDRAAEGYLELAKVVGRVPSGSAQALRALKQWLVIEVRVKNGGTHAADVLASAAEQLVLSEVDRRVVKGWEDDLRSPLPTEVETSPLVAVSKLLTPVMVDITEEANRLRVVSTLRATSILHKFLDSGVSGDERRKAEFLLALAYTRIPIQSFEVLRELYLERCIRMYPGTNEAKSAYLLYAGLIEQESTGSGGTHIDDQTMAKLDELKRIAFSAPAAS